MGVFRAVFIGLVCLFALLAIGWIVEGNEFALYKFFAPKREEVRRQVFENTKSYSQGTIQELESFSIAYSTADKAGKQNICSIVRHRMADFPEERVPGHLIGFVNGCR